MTISCAQESRESHEPLAGTAPTALTWVAVEEPGPWGSDALRDSSLPEALRASLLRLKQAGVGVVLIRRPERRMLTGPRTLLLARTAPGGTLLREGELLSDDELDGWQEADLATGRLPGFGRIASHPHLLVCTNGRRDACCAVEGRALISALMDRTPPPERVWECSHLGGHRFAPVTMTLPSGMVHGRIEPAAAEDLLKAVADGVVIPELLRGRSSFPHPLQSAGIAVRRLIGERRSDAVDVLAVIGDRAIPVDARWTPPADVIDCVVRHLDGRSWQVQVNRVLIADSRRESCRGDAQPAYSWRADPPIPLPPWQ